MKIKGISIILVMIMITSTIVIGADVEDDTLYVPHGAIRINSDGEFAIQAGINGWPGDGSEGAPYVIFDYEITGVGPGIYIGNTSVHFIIDSNYIHSITGTSGMELFNVENGIVLNNIIDGVTAPNSAVPGGDGGTASGIFIDAGIGLTIANNSIANITGGNGGDGSHGSGGAPPTDGSPGGDGGGSFGIYVYDSPFGTIANNDISLLLAGNGGLGGNGGEGDYESGSDGAFGGDGGMGGAAAGIFLATSEQEVTGNQIAQLAAADGGSGGAGGTGAGTMFGTPGNGGFGGYAGDGGLAAGILISNQPSTLQNNYLDLNTISQINGGDGGWGGPGGDGGTKDFGTGGNGGDGGWGGNAGEAAGSYCEIATGIIYDDNDIHDIFAGSIGFAGTGGFGGGMIAGLDGSNGQDGWPAIPAGIKMVSVGNTEITRNHIHDIVGYYVHLDTVDNSFIYYNSFINCANGEYETHFNPSNNQWDNGYPNGGNYWFDYGGVDFFEGVNQDILGEDGFGDTPRAINEDFAVAQDRYPLIWDPAGTANIDVLETVPADEEVGVVEDTMIQVTFDPRINSIPTLTQTSGTPVTYTFAGLITVYQTDDTATWTHPDWVSGEDITLEVNNIRSYPVAEYALPYSWSFTVGDTKAPTVLSTTPADGSTGAGLTDSVVAVFNETLNTLVTPALAQLVGDDPGYTFTGFSTTNVPDDTLTWTHPAWTDEDAVTLEISLTEDMAGNAMTPYSWSFDTEDITDPNVLSTIPVIAATSVPKGQNVVVVFTETMDTGAIPFITMDAGTNPGGWTFLGWSTTNVADDTATWSHNDWLDGEMISMRVQSYRDLEMNWGPPVNWAFWIEDTVSPDVDNTSPADGATDVFETFNNVNIYFSESMNGSITPTLTQITGDVVGYTFLGWFTTYVENDTAAWNHAAQWSSNDLITLNVTGQKDLAGNTGAPYEWSFTIRDYDDPYILETTPPDGATGVALDTTIVVVFSEPMLYEGNLVVTTGFEGEVYTFQGLTQTYVENDTATWTHTGWNEGRFKQITLQNFQDMNSHIVTESFSFTTVDPTPPTVEWIQPQDGQFFIPYDRTVIVRFNESMNTSQIPTLTQTQGDVVAYTFAGWSTTDVADDTASWTHPNWSDGDQITLNISDYKDLSDNTGDPYDWTFTITDTIDPWITSTSPADGDMMVPTGTTPIVIDFSEDMNTALTPVINYLQYDFTNPAITFSHWQTDSSVVFDVAAPFTEQDHIWLEVSGGMEDLYGKAVPSYNWQFHIEDYTNPGISHTMPFDGDFGILPDTMLEVYFTERLNHSVEPTLTQTLDDPGGWAFGGFGTWETGEQTCSMAYWTHNNWTSEEVELTVSGYQDFSDNSGAPYNWTFSIFTEPIGMPHPPIRINSNADMDMMATAEGWDGDGSAGWPYIIENYDIAGDSWPYEGWCIYIGNTTYHFEIVNNLLHYVWTPTPVEPWVPNSAIVLYNVINGVIGENQIEDVYSDYGIYLDTVQDTAIYGNFINKTFNNGIFMTNCNFLYIENNTIEGDPENIMGTGIYALDSPFNQMVDNKIYYMSNGILLENSGDGELHWNEIFMCEWGITLDPSSDTDSDNILIENNTMLGCGLFVWGWEIRHWDSHTVVNNMVNGGELVYLMGEFMYDLPPETRAGQIFIVDSQFINIDYQVFQQATVGIQAFSSSDITINNCTFVDNMWGIFLGATQVLAYHNTFIGNDVHVNDDWGASDWDNGYPISGNFWDDYIGVDNFWGPDQNIPGFSDGVGDTQYDFFDGAGGTDNYPLMDPLNYTTFDIPMDEGWNFISLPLLPADFLYYTNTTIDNVLESLNYNWDMIMVYDPMSPGSPWRTFNSDIPDQLNDLWNLTHIQGIWINVTQTGQTLSISGYMSAYIDIDLYAGWNLIGYPAIDDTTYSIGDMKLDTGATIVEGFNASAPYDISVLADAYIMKKGEAYWVYVPADTTWTVNILGHVTPPDDLLSERTEYIRDHPDQISDTMGNEDGIPLDVGNDLILVTKAITIPVALLSLIVFMFVLLTRRRTTGRKQ